MNKIIVWFAALCCAINLSAQNTLTIKVIHAATGEPLPGVSAVVKGLPSLSLTQNDGMAVMNLPTGRHLLIFSHVGFETKEITVDMPYRDSLLQVALEPHGEEEEEVIVRSTRTSRTIRNVPTRVEAISMEEIDEKSNMRPANISMLLHESTGIQVQQTSATSGNASIRIQGLDGRYTQLLKDGFATFGNFASGLSVLEIPPLDLKQVEIIKGPASTLYGGGAIAGVVNFISKTPTEKQQHNLLLNQSHIGQSNVGYFAAKRNAKTGYTLLALFNRQAAYDVDQDDFTEVPESIELVLHPKVFIYPNANTTWIFGNSFTKGDRKGGDVQVIRGKADNVHRYFEENNTIRNITTAELYKRLGGRKDLTVKQSFSLFDRHIRIPGYHFDGVNYNSFTDISLLTILEKHDIVTGANIVYDHFDERRSSAANRDNKNITAGAYIQDTWDASDNIKLESGLRVDWVRYSNAIFARNEVIALPRISVLIRYNSQLSSRIGGGMGYKVPTLFTERTESMQYRDIQQLSNVRSERSYGGTADINFQARLGGDFDFSFNHMFFYTWIQRPLVLEDNGGGSFSFVNAGKPVISQGFETNAKLIFKHDFKLFLGYTFTDANAKYITGNQFLPLVPKHKFNSALIYEKHDFLKLGLEGYYTSPQYLYSGFRTKPFWEFGFMAEKLYERFSVFVNFENFTDTRQSRFRRVANDPHDNPTFDDIWTHTEGFVVNGGIKLKL